MAEAISWLEDKGQVAIYCEAVRAVDGPMDPRMEHRRRRSFQVICGTSELYVTAILVAVISGACRNLGDDMKCQIYERRPLVCRIYPAEVSPFIQMDAATKVCPPEAWVPFRPQPDPFSEYLPELAERSRQTDYREALKKGCVCNELGIDATALADEGYVRHLPEPGDFLAALKSAYDSDEKALPISRQWWLYSPSLAKLDCPGLAVIAAKPESAAYSFLRA